MDLTMNNEPSKNMDSTMLIALDLIMELLGFNHETYDVNINSWDLIWIMHSKH